MRAKRTPQGSLFTPDCPDRDRGRLLADVSGQLDRHPQFLGLGRCRRERRKPLLEGQGGLDLRDDSARRGPDVDGAVDLQGDGVPPARLECDGKVHADRSAGAFEALRAEPLHLRRSPPDMGTDRPGSAGRGPRREDRRRERDPHRRHRDRNPHPPSERRCCWIRCACSRGCWPVRARSWGARRSGSTTTSGRRSAGCWRSARLAGRSASSCIGNCRRRRGARSVAADVIASPTPLQAEAFRLLGVRP